MPYLYIIPSPGCGNRLEGHRRDLSHPLSDRQDQEPGDCAAAGAPLLRVQQHPQPFIDMTYQYVPYQSTPLILIFTYFLLSTD